jgi:hypothetical protein
MALSPDGKTIASNYALWDRATGKELGRFKWEDSRVGVVAYSPDGRTLAMAAGQYDDAGKGRVIRLRDAVTLRERQHFGEQPVCTLRYSPDGKTLAAGNYDGTLVLWDVDTGRERRRIRVSGREVDSLDFSPDGTTLAAGSFDGDLFLWDAATGKQIRMLARGEAARRRQIIVNAVVFAPSGKMLVSAEGPYGSEDGASITFWETATGRVRRRLAGHLGRVTALAFTRDGRTLLSGSADTTALVWDVLGSPSAAPAGGFEKAWEDLAGEDAARAYAAICALASSPDGVKILQKRLTPARAADSGRLARLIKDLNSDVFADRNRASEELEKLGEAAEPALRAALRNAPPAEVRRRVERLLNKHSPEWLRTQRALEALELAGTPAAKSVLQSLAGGAPEARLSLEAKAALKRWAPRPGS